jgi:uncharacterized protein (DUF1501 family)
MITRRDFLKRSTLVALAPSIPAFLAETARSASAEPDSRVLVVIQLDGGNDGINTIVPFADEGYAKHRKALRLPKERLIRISDTVGLHPSLAEAGKLLESGRLAIVQGVSYPNPSRSHFRSMAIWQSARLAAEDQGGLGWLGRALDEQPPVAAASLLIGSGPLPSALRGRRSIASALEKLDDIALPAGVDPRKALLTPAHKVSDLSSGGSDLTAFVRRSMLDAYTTADRLAEIGKGANTATGYPATGLAQRLQTIARLIKAGLGIRVYYTSQGTYDTHSFQLQTHSQLLGQLSGALKAFLDDLTAPGLRERVAVLMFSEFGRTVAENSSAGTDHGTAGPVLLAGNVKAGLVGSTPSLVDLDPKHGDLRGAIDFRQVYATVLENWLGLPAKPSLGGAFVPLPLF